MTQTKTWTQYDACACVEGFDGLEHSAADTLSAWQHLIDSDAVWHLQGWYGRAAQQLIDTGHCHAKVSVI